jgi:hypothetical protein
MHTEGKPVLIRCYIYDPEGPKYNPVRVVEQDARGMTKAEALDTLATIQRDPCAGTGTVYLDNGNHI